MLNWGGSLTPDKSIYRVNLQLDNDSFPLIKDHDFDWTIDDDAMMWHAMMIADPLKSVSKGLSACLIYNSIVLEIYRHVLYKYTLFKNFFIALCTAVHFITHIYLLITDTPSTSILMSVKWNASALRQNFKRPLTETKEREDVPDMTHIRCFRVRGRKFLYRPHHCLYHRSHPCRLDWGRLLMAKDFLR